MKRNKKKMNNPYNGIPYTPGRNIFGEKVRTKLVILEKDTAFSQMVEALCHIGENEEITFNATCFKGCEDEYMRILDRVEKFLFS